VMVTFAFVTTAPLGSVIVPVMPALACANPVRGANEMRHAIAIATHHPPNLERRRDAPSFETGNSFTLPPGLTQLFFEILKQGSVTTERLFLALNLGFHGIDTIFMVAIPFRETIRLAKIDCQAIF